MWTIVQVNSTVFQDISRTSVYGYAVHTSNLAGINDPTYQVCTRFPQVNQTVYEGQDVCKFMYTVIGINTPETCYVPYPCMSVLEHELKHLKCECNWHVNLIGKAAPIII